MATVFSAADYVGLFCEGGRIPSFDREMLGFLLAGKFLGFCRSTNKEPKRSTFLEGFRSQPRMFSYPGEGNEGAYVNFDLAEGAIHNVTRTQSRPSFPLFFPSYWGLRFPDRIPFKPTRVPWFIPR